MLARIRLASGSLWLIGANPSFGCPGNVTVGGEGLSGTGSEVVDEPPQPTTAKTKLERTMCRFINAPRNENSAEKYSAI